MTAQHDSNDGGQIFQSHSIITPAVFEAPGESVGGELTSKQGTRTPSIITPTHFVITPTCVESHWETLGERNTGISLAYPVFEI